MSKSTKGNSPPSMPILASTDSMDQPSNHRASLFSPSMSPSEIAMAEAGVAAMAKFSVPVHYDPQFYHQPDGQSVLVHALASSHKDAGSQAIIVLHPRSTLPPHLGLPTTSRIEETVFLMTSSKNEPFVMYSQAPRGTTLQISVAEYLTLVHFFIKDWNRLKSKLEMQTDKMRDGKDPLAISSHLSFYSHGCIQYSVALSQRLLLKIKADSKKPVKDDEYLSGWLEQRVGNHLQECILALQALNAMSQHTHAIKMLTDIVSSYKNRSRKRSKPVE